VQCGSADRDQRFKPTAVRFDPCEFSFGVGEADFELASGRRQPLDQSFAHHRTSPMEADPSPADAEDARNGGAPNAIGQEARPNISSSDLRIAM
jgi:hypothetical protein